MGVPRCLQPSVPRVANTARFRERRAEGQRRGGEALTMNPRIRRWRRNRHKVHGLMYSTLQFFGLPTAGRIPPDMDAAPCKYHDVPISLNPAGSDAGAFQSSERDFGDHFRFGSRDADAENSLGIVLGLALGNVDSSLDRHILTVPLNRSGILNNLRAET